MSGSTLDVRRVENDYMCMYENGKNVEHRVEYKNRKNQRDRLVSVFGFRLM